MKPSHPPANHLPAQVARKVSRKLRARATPPTLPVQAGPLRNILLGAFIGLLLTGVIAFTLEYMDDTLKTPQDVASVLGLPVVGGSDAHTTGQVGTTVTEFARPVADERELAREIREGRVRPRRLR